MRDIGFKEGDVVVYAKGTTDLWVYVGNDRARKIAYINKTGHSIGDLITCHPDDSPCCFRHATAEDMEKAGFGKVAFKASWRTGLPWFIEKEGTYQLRDGSWWRKKEEKVEEKWMTMKEAMKIWIDAPDTVFEFGVSGNRFRFWDYNKGGQTTIQYLTHTKLGAGSINNSNISSFDKVRIAPPIDLAKQRREATISRQWLRDNAPSCWQKRLDDWFDGRDKVLVETAIGGMNSLNHDIGSTIEPDYHIVASFLERHGIITKLGKEGQFKTYISTGKSV